MQHAANSMRRRLRRRCVGSASLIATYVGNGESGERAWTFVNNANACLHTVDPPRGELGDVWEKFSSKTCHADSHADLIFSQRSKAVGRGIGNQFTAVAMITKTLPIAAQRAITLTLVMMLTWMIGSNDCAGQLVDDLDSYPPRWQLDTDGSGAKILNHQNKSAGGFDGGPYESITVLSSEQDAILVYPIEPVRILDDLTAIIHLRSVNSGARIGFRIRYPYLIDPLSRRSVTRVIDATKYKDSSDWQRIGIGAVNRLAQNATVTVRGQFGRDADVRDAMIDAVTVRVPAHPGRDGQTIDLDRLTLTGMIAVATSQTSDLTSPPAGRASAARQSLDDPSSTDTRQEGIGPRRAFGDGMTRVIEYRGEPMVWLRSLGFDAIWLDRPIDAAILSEAHRSRLSIYSPVPTVLDPALTPLLQPVAGWIVQPTGSLQDDENQNAAGQQNAAADDPVLDGRYLRSVAAATKRLRELPSRWQRPIIAAPVENLGDYGRHLDAVVRHLPPRARGLSATEEIEDHRQQIGLVPADVQMVLGIDSQPPRRAADQNRLVSSSHGGALPNTRAWQSLWCQTIRQIASGPDAILYRSADPLSLGDPATAGRASALSYINRMTAMIESTFSQRSVRSSHQFVKAKTSGRTPFVVQRASGFGASWYFITSDETSTCHAAAGDGGSIELSIDGGLAYRLTHFSAEMLPIDDRGGGGVVEIVSPDVCEIIVVTDDASLGGRLATAAATFRGQAAIDRMALAQTALQRVASERQFVETLANANANQQLFDSMQSVRRQLQRDQRLIEVAADTLSSTQSSVASGDTGAALRSAARADAWISRAAMSLRRSMTDDTDSLVSWPSMMADDLRTHWMVQTTLPGASLPSLDTGNAPPTLTRISNRRSIDVVKFGKNLLPSGSLDTPEMMGRTGGDQRRWSIGRRLSEITASEVSHTVSDTYAGTGAVRAAAWLKPNPDSVYASASASASHDLSAPTANVGGGYGGTILQIQSPPVRFGDHGLPFETVVIAALVKTVGFAGPHQGLLVYDSIGGPELGIMVRRRPGWTPVQLVRHVAAGSSLSVQFELIGPGEAIVDEVSIRRVEPATAGPAIRPLGQR